MLDKVFEALKKIGNLHSITKGCAICFTDEYKVIKQALLELQAIKEAKPSEALDKLEECANGMKDLPKSNWIDLAESEAELDLKIMDWIETIKFELFKGKQALTELQQIKSASPTKALECLEEIKRYFLNRRYECAEYPTNPFNNVWVERITTIKQALTQKSKKELAFDVLKEYFDIQIIETDSKEMATIVISRKDNNSMLHFAQKLIKDKEKITLLKEVLKNGN